MDEFGNANEAFEEWWDADTGKSWNLKPRECFLAGWQACLIARISEEHERIRVARLKPENRICGQ
jgi:hypothetical protein